MKDHELFVLSEEPFNAETAFERQRGMITDSGRHYVRAHFSIPGAPASFSIDGAVREPTRISLDALRSFPQRSLAVTLECAGNGRSFLEPAVPGEQWRLGAVGTAEWTGASLREILARAAPRDGAVEVLFRGADAGTPKDLGRPIAYERSLPIADALADDVLVAHAMNGQPIPPAHGGPIRLVVPGWYGMASVKWLAAITLVENAFRGFYQTDRYVIDGAPLREIAPRAVIVSPTDGATLVGPRVAVRGYAWSGHAPIERVEVCAEPATLIPQQKRSHWRDAKLSPAISAYAWREFALEVAVFGAGPAETELVARARDAAGNVQPLDPRWNALGYANNGARVTRVRVVP
jgi:DMSO/TMAO reductase YedYZ molybdopterin-dependent catalytic subunit